MHVRGSAEGAEAIVERGYSMEEAAKRIGIGRSMTYELVTAGRLESIKLGKRRIIPESAIRAFLAAELEASRAGREHADREAV